MLEKKSKVRKNVRVRAVAGAVIWIYVSATLFNSVLRIRDVYPGSASILTQKNGFLSSRKYDLGCSSRIRILNF